MPDAQTKKVVIDFSINADEAIKNIQEATKKIDLLKKQQKELAEQGEKNSETYIKNAAAIKEYNAVVRANEKEIRNQIKSLKENGDSLNSMRAVLNNMKAAYADMSKAERDSAKGDELIQKIKEQTEAVSNLEHEMGDWQRQVGHYEQAIAGLPGPLGTVTRLFANLSNGTGSLKVALKNGGEAVKGFSKELIKLAANPIVLVITGIVLAVKKLVDAFKKNDDAMTGLQRAFSAFQPIINLVNKAFESLANAIAKVVGGIANVFKAVMSLIPGYKEAADAADALVVEQDKLQDAERDYAVESAKRNKQISENNAKIADKEKTSAKDRIKLLEENAILEKKNAKEAADIAKRKYEIAKKQAQQDADTSDETKNKLAELQAAAINAEAAYSDAMVSINKRTSAAIKEIDREEAEEAKKREEAAKKAMEAAKRRKDVEEELIKDVEQAYIDAMDESWEKQKKLLEKSYKDEIDTLKKRLKEDKDLNDKSRKAINELIVLKQKELNKKLVLEDAKYWGTYRENAKKALRDYESFRSGSFSELSVIRYFDEMQNEIDAVYDSSAKMAENIKKAFSSTLEDLATRSNFIKHLFDIKPDLDITNFEKFVAEMSVLQKDTTEFWNDIGNNKAIQNLYAMINKYKSTFILAQSQIQKVIENRSEDFTRSIRESMFNAITNGSLDMFKKLLENSKVLSGAALQYGDDITEQFKGYMLNIDSIIAEYESTLESMPLTENLQAARVYLNELYKVKDLFDKIKNNNKDDLELRRKIALVDDGSRVAEIEIAKINLENLKSQQEKLKIQLDYQKSLTSTVSKREEEYKIIDREVKSELARLNNNKATIKAQLEIVTDDAEKEQLMNQLNDIEKQADSAIKRSQTARKALAETGYMSSEELSNSISETEVAISEMNNNINKSTKEVSEKQTELWLDSFNSVASSCSQVAGAFQQLFSTLAEDNAEYQKFANAMSLVQIMTDMAVGIANAIASGSGVPFPANLAAIASGVAAVVSGIGQAISLFKQNDKTANKPRFAEGGLVGTHTTRRHDDTVDAKLTRGEYVIKAPVVDELGVDFFDRINFGKSVRPIFKTRFSEGGMVSMSTMSSVSNEQFNREQMQDMFSSAVENIHPQVDVQEISHAQNRVKIKQNK